MSSGTLVRGIVVAHADLAEAMVEAVRSIADPDPDALVAVSNVSRSPDGIADAIRQAEGTGPAIVFTDLPTGSCGIAARRVCQEDTAFAMICGVNLPVLLDFVTHRGMPLDELVQRLVDRAHAGIACVPVQQYGDVGGSVQG